MTAALDPGPTWKSRPRRWRALIFGNIAGARPRSQPLSRGSGVGRSLPVSEIDAEARTVTLQDGPRAMCSPDPERAGTTLVHTCTPPEGASNWVPPEDRSSAIYIQYTLLRDGEMCGRCGVTFDALYQRYRERRARPLSEDVL